MRIYCCASALLTFSTLWFVASLEADDGQQDLQKQIKRLIEELGDANYSKREFAKSELERIGFVTLDQLQAASFHPDPQIAATARFMVNSNQYNWTGEFDIPRVREILNNFAVAETERKLLHIDQLAQLQREEGIPALCRLARYEPQGTLAKQAALHVLNSKPWIGTTPQIRSKRILALMDGGQSVPSKWIAKHLTTQGPIDLNWWQEQIDQEARLLEARSTETSLAVISALKRWTVEKASAVPKLRDQAVGIAKTIVTQMDRVSSLSLSDKTAKSIEIADWALSLRLHELVQFQHARLSFKALQREPILSYYLAESFLLQGKQDLAESISAAALDSKPSAIDGSLLNPPDTNTTEDTLKNSLESTLGYRNLSNKERRQIIGEKLAKRGLFDWAEREYRIAASDDLTLPTTLRSIRQLAELQHSLERFDDAKASLQVFVDRYQKEPLFRSQMRDRDMAFLTSNILTLYHLYAGDADRVNGIHESAIEHYTRSLEIDSENVDALIGLFKVDGNEEHKNRCRTKLEAVSNELQSKIRQFEEITRDASNIQYAESVRFLANYLNSLAWVISNTEGDFKAAIAMSRRAVQLNPDEPALLDTLAHCYFAAGKWEEAVEQQRKALDLKPNDPSLRRALSRFEEQLARMKSPIPAP